MKPLPANSMTLSFLLLCLVATIFLLASSLIPTIHQQHILLLRSTRDLITKAKSSSIFMFFTCNVIIVCIIVGSQGTSNGEFDGFVPAPFVEEDGMQIDEPVYQDVESNEDDYASEDGDGRSGYDEDDEYGGVVGDDSDNCTSDDAEELHTRIEEFIAKTISKWREELWQEMWRENQGLVWK